MSSEDSPQTTPDAEFDAFAEDYDAALDRGLALTGESKTFFAEGRVKWLAGCLRKAGHTPGRCLDFGCGTGTAAPFLLDLLGAESITGIDPSEDSLQVARRDHGSTGADYTTTADFAAEAEFDSAYCNGVFHHIPPADRPGAVAQVFTALRPGGYFSLWENNPWNPVTRFMMSRVPFDKDAILLWPGETRRLLRAAGFEICRTDFAFIFPAALSALRRLEPALCKFPLGGQYQVLARKP